MVKYVRQKYKNDCGIAAIAMATGIAYPVVLRIAKKAGFKPNSKYGIYPHKIIELIGFNVGMNWGKYKRLRIKPFKLNNQIAVVPSLNVRNKDNLHAVVLHRGRVYDPSPRRKSNLAHVKRTARYGYIIRKEKP